MTSSFISAALNHLLAQDAEARRKLARHAGKIARFDAGIATLALLAGADGLLQGAPSGAAPDVLIRINPADLPFLARQPERAFAQVKVEGDAEFASTISQLSQSLRWDAEQDAARLIGDIGAARLATGARQAFSQARTAQQKLLENLAEYFLEENRMLMRQEAVTEFSVQVNVLRDDTERLAKRIARLAGERG